MCQKQLSVLFSIAPSMPLSPLMQTLCFHAELQSTFSSQSLLPEGLLQAVPAGRFSKPGAQREGASEPGRS